MYKRCQISLETNILSSSFQKYVNAQVGLKHNYEGIMFKRVQEIALEPLFSLEGKPLLSL